MSSIVNNPFRVFTSAEFVKYHKNTNNPLYIAIAKSSDWITSHPENLHNTNNERSLFIENIIGMKKIEPSDIVPVITKHLWVSGDDTYTPFDKLSQNAQFSKFYTLNSEGNVYQCVSRGMDVVSIEPTGHNNGADISTGDGYVWKYYYSLKADEYDEYHDTNWMPIHYGDDSTQDQIDYGSIYVNVAFGAANVLIKSKLCDDGMVINTSYRQIGYISRPSDSDGVQIDDIYPEFADINPENMDVIFIENRYPFERKIGKWEKIRSILTF